MRLICVLLFVLYFGSSYGQRHDDYFEKCQIVEQNGKFGILLENRLSVPYEYDEIIPQPDSFFKVKKGQKYGIITYFYSRDKFRFSMGNDAAIFPLKRGYVLLQLALPCQFDKIEDFDDQYLLLRREGKLGLANHYGSLLIPCRFDKLESRDNSIWVTAADKHGVYNRYGSTILPCQFEKIEFRDNVYYVVRDLNQGIYNRYGSVIIPTQYTDIREAGNTFWVEKGELKGVVNRYGSTIIACRFNEISRKGENYYVSREGKYGVFNRYGSKILPCNFEKIECMANGQYIASQGGNKKLYNAYGSFLGGYSEANVIYSTEKLPD